MKKKRCSIRCDPTIWNQAETLGINRSKVCEDALTREVNLINSKQSTEDLEKKRDDFIRNANHLDTKIAEKKELESNVEQMENLKKKDVDKVMVSIELYLHKMDMEGLEGISMVQIQKFCDVFKINIEDVMEEMRKRNMENLIKESAGVTMADGSVY